MGGVGAALAVLAGVGAVGLAVFGLGGVAVGAAVVEIVHLVRNRGPPGADATTTLTPTGAARSVWVRRAAAGVALVAVVWVVGLVAAAPAEAIVGGGPAPREAWAAEVDRSFPEHPTWKSTPLGSGVLIGPRWVATAAHVGLDRDGMAQTGHRARPDQMSVRVGSSRLGRGREIAVTDIEISPNGDIALLRLAAPARGPYLPLGYLTGHPLPLSSPTASVYGFGVTATLRDDPYALPSPVLKTAQVALDGTGLDLDGGPAIRVRQVTGLPAPGDSGGPLVYHGMAVGLDSRSADPTVLHEPQDEGYEASIGASRGWIEHITGIRVRPVDLSPSAATLAELGAGLLAGLGVLAAPTIILIRRHAPTRFGDRAARPAVAVVLALVAVGLAGSAPTPPSRPAPISGGAWAGYAITLPSGQLSSVSASWIEPAAGPPNLSEATAFWVGLGGYPFGTLQQTGTVTNTDETPFSPRPWWTPVTWSEMYPYNPSYGAATSFPVHPGDLITASVTRESQRFTLTVTNTTAGWTRTTTQPVPYPNPGAGTSAEIITEIPGDESVMQPRPFTPVRFFHITINGQPINPHQAQPLQGNLPSGQQWAQVSPINYDSFTVTSQPAPALPQPRPRPRQSPSFGLPNTPYPSPNPSRGPSTPPTGGPAQASTPPTRTTQRISARGATGASSDPIDTASSESPTKPQPHPQSALPPRNTQPSKASITPGQTTALSSPPAARHRMVGGSRLRVAGTRIGWRDPLAIGIIALGFAVPLGQPTASIAVIAVGSILVAVYRLRRPNLGDASEHFVISRPALIVGYAIAIMARLMVDSPELYGMLLPEPLDVVGHTGNLIGGAAVAHIAVYAKRIMESRRTGSKNLTPIQLGSFYSRWVPGVLVLTALIDTAVESRWGVSLLRALGLHVAPVRSHTDLLGMTYSGAYSGLVAMLVWRGERGVGHSPSNTRSPRRASPRLVSERIWGKHSAGPSRWFRRGLILFGVLASAGLSLVFGGVDIARADVTPRVQPAHAAILGSWPSWPVIAAASGLAVVAVGLWAWRRHRAGSSNTDWASRSGRRAGSAVGSARAAVAHTLTPAITLLAGIQAVWHMLGHTVPARVMRRLIARVWNWLIDSALGVWLWRLLTRLFPGLKKPNYRRYIGGQAISLFGTFMQLLAQDLLALKLGGPSALSSAMTAQAGPTALALVGGWLIDRFGLSKTLKLLEAAMLASSAALWGFYVLGVLHLGELYWFAGITGALATVETTARLALLPKLVEPEQISRSAALHAMVTQVGRVAGTGLGGVLIETIGFSSTFLINAVSFVAMIAALQAMQLEAPDESPKQSLRDYLRGYTNIQPSLLWVLGLVFAVTAIGMNINMTLPLLATEVFHHGDAVTAPVERPGATGGLYAAFALGAFGAAAWNAKFGGRHLELDQVVRAAVIFGTIAVLSSLRFGQFSTSLMLIAIGGASMRFLLKASVYLTDKANSGLTGLVLGLYVVASTGAPVLSPVHNLLITHYGVPSAVRIDYVFTLLIALTAAIVTRTPVINLPRTRLVARIPRVWNMSIHRRWIFPSEARPVADRMSRLVGWIRAWPRQKALISGAGAVAAAAAVLAAVAQISPSVVNWLSRRSSQALALIPSFTQTPTTGVPLWPFAVAGLVAGMPALVMVLTAPRVAARFVRLWMARIVVVVVVLAGVAFLAVPAVAAGTIGLLITQPVLWMPHTVALLIPSGIMVTAAILAWRMVGHAFSAVAAIVAEWITPSWRSRRLLVVLGAATLSFTLLVRALAMLDVGHTVLILAGVATAMSLVSWVVWPRQPRTRPSRFSESRSVGHNHRDSDAGRAAAGWALATGFIGTAAVVVHLATGADGFVRYLWADRLHGLTHSPTASVVMVTVAALTIALAWLLARQRGPPLVRVLLALVRKPRGWLGQRSVRSYAAGASLAMLAMVALVVFGRHLAGLGVLASAIAMPPPDRRGGLIRTRVRAGDVTTRPFSSEEHLAIARTVRPVLDGLPAFSRGRPVMLHWPLWRQRFEAVGLPDLGKELIVYRASDSNGQPWRIQFAHRGTKPDRPHSDVTMLIAIQANPGLTVAEMARLLGRDPEWVRRRVDKLIHRWGLVHSAGQDLEAALTLAAGVGSLFADLSNIDKSIDLTYQRQLRHLRRLLSSIKIAPRGPVIAHALDRVLAELRRNADSPIFGQPHTYTSSRHSVAAILGLVNARPYIIGDELAAALGLKPNRLAAPLSLLVNRGLVNEVYQGQLPAYVLTRPGVRLLELLVELATDDTYLHGEELSQLTGPFSPGKDAIALRKLNDALQAHARFASSTETPLMADLLQVIGDKGPLKSRKISLRIGLDEQKIRIRLSLFVELGLVSPTPPSTPRYTLTADGRRLLRDARDPPERMSPTYRAALWWLGQPAGDKRAALALKKLLSPAPHQTPTALRGLGGLLAVPPMLDTKIVGVGLVAAGLAGLMVTVVIRSKAGLLLVELRRLIDAAREARAAGKQEEVRRDVALASVKAYRLRVWLNSKLGRLVLGGAAVFAGLAEMQPLLDELQAWLPRYRQRPLAGARPKIGSRLPQHLTPPEWNRLYVWRHRFYWAKNGKPLNTGRSGTRAHRMVTYGVDVHGNFYAGLAAHYRYFGWGGPAFALGMMTTVPNDPGVVEYMNNHSGTHDSDLGQLQRLVEELGLDLRHVVADEQAPGTTIHRPQGETSYEFSSSGLPRRPLPADPLGVATPHAGFIARQLAGLHRIGDRREADHWRELGAGVLGAVVGGLVVRAELATLVLAGVGALAGVALLAYHVGAWLVARAARSGAQRGPPRWLVRVVAWVHASPGQRVLPVLALAVGVGVGEAVRMVMFDHVIALSLGPAGPYQACPWPLWVWCGGRVGHRVRTGRSRTRR